MSGAGGLVTLIVFVAVLVLTNRARRLSATMDLPRGQRLRPLRLLLIEPVLYVVLVGALLWDELSASSSHVLAALAGAVVGVGFGVYRARIMYVRADPAHQGVILTRSTAEYVAVAVLALLEIGRSDLQDHSARMDSPWSLLVTALMALALAEAVGRIAATVGRYRREVAGGRRPVPEPA